MAFGLLENERSTTTSLLASLSENLSRSAAQIWDRLSVQPVRHRPGEEHLMVVLQDPLLVYKLKLRNYGTELQLVVTVQVRDVSDNQMIVVEGDCVTFFEQPPEVVVMTRQLV